MSDTITEENRGFPAINTTSSDLEVGSDSKSAVKAQFR